MSVPYCTSEPTLVQQGNKLIAGNGGWANDAGPGTINGYVYAFQLDGVTVQGETPLLFEGTRRNESGELVTIGRPPDVMPIGFGWNEFELYAFAVGKQAVVFVYGGSRVRYFTADGKLSYDGWEWGRLIPAKHDAPAKSSPLTIAAFSEPEPIPSPPSGDRRLELDPRVPEIRDNTREELRLATATFVKWRDANPREYGWVLQYLSDLADGFATVPPSLATHKGRGIIGLLQAAAATVGRLP